MADPAPPNSTEAAATPRKRPLFQFHLSTAVILMFVAGGLIWLNVNERHFGRGAEGSLIWVVSDEYGRGWPVSPRIIPSPLRRNDLHVS